LIKFCARLIEWDSSEFTTVKFCLSFHEYIQEVISIPTFHSYSEQKLQVYKSLNAVSCLLRSVHLRFIKFQFFNQNSSFNRTEFSNNNWQLVFCNVFIVILYLTSSHHFSRTSLQFPELYYFYKYNSVLWKLFLCIFSFHISRTLLNQEDREKGERLNILISAAYCFKVLCLIPLVQVFQIK
jgi:hypothetical protein